MTTQKGNNEQKYTKIVHYGSFCLKIVVKTLCFYHIFEYFCTRNVNR